MKCANCGNENQNTLFDEGDTFYCSLCRHRTQTATGQDDLITCPYCGRLRDRKAYQCMWCNNTIDQNNPPTIQEYVELDRLLTEFEDNMDESNIRYWKLRDKKKK
jgi:DNA-directed RNA polymerase subunit RPC12/RpoP